MIKYNNSNINDWYFDESNIIKVYRNGAVVFYKFDSEQGGYKVCYAVVDDISQYSETEFEDVFDKETEKWFKLNNLNQYEEYGIYGSGRSVTTYNGKLTIDNGYEYEWNGSSWVNLGEVSGSSVVEYIETPTSSPYAGIELLTSPSSQSTPMYYEVDCLVKSNQGDNSILGQKSGRETVSYQFGFQAYNSPYYDYGGRRLNTNWPAIGGLNNRIKVGFGVNSGDSKVVIKNLDTSTIVQSTTATPTNVTIPLLCNAKYNTNTSGDTFATSGQVRYYGIKIYDNNVLVGDYIPAKNPSTNEYTFYETISQRYCSKIGTGTIAGHEGGHYEYPKYYSEQSDPPNNLTFNTMEDADNYAYNNCVYVGLNALIGSDKYVFSGDSQSGYEWVYNPSRLPQGYTEVEYVENTSTAYINTGVYLYDTTTTSYNIQCKCYFQPYGNNFEYLFGTEGTSSPYVGVTFRYYQRNIQYASNPDNVSWTHMDNGDGTSGVTASCASTTATNGNNPLTLFCGLWSNGPWRNGRGKIYSFKVTKNDTLVIDLVPAKRDSDDKYGMYDLITDTFYLSPNNVDFSGGDPV